MVSRVIKRITLAFILAIAPHLAHSETAHALGVARLELAALQIEGQLPQCSGMLISSDLLVTSDECLLDAIGSPLGAVSVLPGLNTAEETGAHAAKPGYREFGVAAYPQGNGISILRLGAIEGRPPPGSFMAAAARSIDPKPGQSLEVLHYGGLTQPVQAFTVCAVTEVGSATGRLDCLLPEMGRGAPLLSNGTPIGIIQNPADREGATFSLFPSSGMELIQTEEVIFPAVIFTGIDVINACDVDIHQGLFWLDIDGITWRDLGKRIPAHSRTLLPAATVGDSIFSYARSDDGIFEWSGDDLQVEITGITLPMVQVPVPQPVGDLTLTYACE